MSDSSPSPEVNLRLFQFLHPHSRWCRPPPLVTLDFLWNPQFGPSGLRPHFRFKDPVFPNLRHITFPRLVSSFSDDMVDFLCSKISIFDVQQIQPTVLPTPNSSKVEIGFWLHSNKNHITFSRLVSSFSDDIVDFLCRKNFKFRCSTNPANSQELESRNWLLVTL